MLNALVNGAYGKVGALLIYQAASGESVADYKADAGPTSAYALSSLDQGSLYFTGQNSATGVDAKSLDRMERGG